MKYLMLIVGLLGAFSSQAQADSAMTRINKTNTLRCGYVEYKPALMKDLKTGAWSGFDYDMVQAIASRLELKVEYAAATGWATVVADLDAGKFDMLCSGFWVHPNVGKFALFSKPEFYQPVFVVARADDARFSAGTRLDDASLRMVALEGDNPVNIAKADFPRAQMLLLPNMTDFSQVLVSVADKKADFTIVDGATFGAYNDSNPGKLKIVAPDRPVRVYPTSFVFNKDDAVLRDAVNAALDEMVLDGTVERIIARYSQYPHVYYTPKMSYEEVSKAKKSAREKK